MNLSSQYFLILGGQDLFLRDSVFIYNFLVFCAPYFAGDFEGGKRT